MKASSECRDIEMDWKVKRTRRRAPLSRAMDQHLKATGSNTKVGRNSSRNHHSHLSSSPPAEIAHPARPVKSSVIPNRSPRHLIQTGFRLVRKRREKVDSEFFTDSCALTYAVAAFISLVGDLEPRVFIAKLLESCTREPLGTAHQSNKGWDSSNRQVIKFKSLD